MYGHTCAFALLAPGDVQAALRARDADIHQATFFFYACRQNFIGIGSPLCGKMPSSTPTRNTCGYSSPFDAQGGHAHRIRLFVLAFHHRHQRHHLRQIEQAAVIVSAVFTATAFGFQPLRKIEHVLPFVLRGAVIEAVVQIAFVIDFLHQIIQQFAGMTFAVGMRFNLIDEGAEFAQRAQLAISQFRFDTALEYGGKQRTLPLPGECAQHFQRRLTNPAFRRRDCADERRVIVFIRNQAQIRNDVFDFSTIKKTLAAGNGVRNPFAQQLARSRAPGDCRGTVSRNRNSWRAAQNGAPRS
jgi:hypothetical protein